MHPPPVHCRADQEESEYAHEYSPDQPALQRHDTSEFFQVKVCREQSFGDGKRFREDREERALW